MHRSYVGQRASIRDVDRQRSGVDAADEVGELHGVAADEDPLRTHSPLGILLTRSHCPDVMPAVCDEADEGDGLLR